MAVVYKAKDRMLERLVAIKLLRQDYSNNEEFRKQFHLEAKSAANLSHPNIITVHDFGYDAGRLFIVMEYLPGNDLKSLIRQNGRFQRFRCGAFDPSSLRWHRLCPPRRYRPLRY